MIENILNEYPMTSLVIIILFALALIVAVVNVPIYYALDYGCSQKAEMLNTEYKFGYWTGCWVKDKKDGTWYEYTTIRNVEVK
ncbi:MAG: hypothetical protein IIZ78_15750 [Clostridiales bacterium]|nr:hypothetical protein [Clostridiales bacterium]